MTWFESHRTGHVYAECAQHAGHTLESAGVRPIGEEETVRPEHPGWETEAMNWSPLAEHEIRLWDDIFNDRRREGRRDRPG